MIPGSGRSPGEGNGNHSSILAWRIPWMGRRAPAGRSALGLAITRGDPKTSSHADDTTLMAESEEELKSLLMKVKEESEKVGLKLRN